MSPTEWKLTVLLPHDENHRLVAAGTGQSRDDAEHALTRSLIEAARRWGRQEFTGVLGERRFLVLPGLTASGLVDEEAIHRAIDDLDR